MRREYIDSMKGKGFGEFLNACEDLKNSKYVIAENKIAALLKSVADNRQLYSMFGAALYEFDYKRTFTECVVGNGFTLPDEPKKAIALVFRILVDIDSGKMPLENFLQAYFYSESVNESFARFGLEIVAPFEAYCRMFFSRADSVNDNVPVFDDDKMQRAYEDVNTKFHRDLRDDALSCVAALIEIAETAIAGVIDRAEYIACLNGLTRCIKLRDYDDIISAFIGVKYAVAYFFKSDKSVIEIYKRLEHDIKHLSD